jgi:hypothetical protein
LKTLALINLAFVVLPATVYADVVQDNLNRSTVLAVASSVDTRCNEWTAPVIKLDGDVPTVDVTRLALQLVANAAASATGARAAVLDSHVCNREQLVGQP